MTDAEKYIERWQAAGLLDGPLVERIRAYESGEQRPNRARWQVTLALVFGALLVSAGILLFVAAHWDEISPASRFLLVLTKVVLLHGLGVYFADRFPKLSTTFHAIGTVALGAAIALTGQIFNMNEHWPAAILLWAIGAGVGWYLLRDGFHEAFTWLLFPVWVICEWADRANNYKGLELYGARMIAVLAAIYLCGFLAGRKSVRAVLMTAGAILLLGANAALLEGWFAWREMPMLPWSLRIAAWVMIAAFATAGFLRAKSSIVPVGVVFAASLLLPYCHVSGNNYRGEPSVFAYLIVGAVTGFMAWWGVRESSRGLINLGIAGFAATVLWFYFSSLMDKLGRSLGLIALGVLFLAGGWLLERFRRSLIRSLDEQKEAA